MSFTVQHDIINYNDNIKQIHERLDIMEKIRLDFENELRNKMFLAKKECQYNPTYFNQMLAEIGRVATAKRLIKKALATGNPSDGFTTLLLKGRLDLTMEDFVCNPAYKDLFEQYEIDYCRKVLGK